MFVYVRISSQSYYNECKIIFLLNLFASHLALGLLWGAYNKMGEMIKNVNRTIAK